MNTDTTSIVSHLERELAALKLDQMRLNWLQSGHCVLCLVAGKTTKHYEFQIDGHQDSPRHPDLRTAIDNAMSAQENEALRNTDRPPTD